MQLYFKCSFSFDHCSPCSWRKLELYADVQSVRSTTEVRVFAQLTSENEVNEEKREGRLLRNKSWILFFPFPKIVSCHPLFPLLLITVQTLNRELQMTRGAEELPLIDVMMKWRSLDLRSCASESLLATDCCGAGCVCCRCGNGDVSADEGDEREHWGVLDCCSTGPATPGGNIMKLKIR